MSPTLIAESLSKYFGNKHVLDNVSFALHRGQCLGLVGANGAGKTTLLYLCAQLLKPDGGRVALPYLASEETSRYLRKPTCLLLVDQPVFAEKHSVMEILELTATLATLSYARNDLLSLLESVGLERESYTRAAKLSSGNKQRLQWAFALLLRPLVLLLDEPTAFLDPPGVIALRQTLRSLLDQGSSVIISSHNMHEVALIADRVLYLKDGKIDIRDVVPGAGGNHLEQYFFHGTASEA